MCKKLWIAILSATIYTSFSYSPATAQDCTTYNAPPRQPGLNGLAGLSNAQLTGLVNVIDRTKTPPEFTIPGLQGMPITDVMALNDAVGNLKTLHGMDPAQITNALNGLSNTSMSAAFPGATSSQLSGLFGNLSNIPGMSGTAFSQVPSLFNTSSPGHVTDAQIISAFPGYDPSHVRNMIMSGIPALPGMATYTVGQANGVISAVQGFPSLQTLAAQPVTTINAALNGLNQLSTMPGMQGLNTSQISGAINSLNNLINLPAISGNPLLTGGQIAVMASEIPGLSNLNIGGMNPYSLSNLLQTLNGLNGLQGLSTRQIESALNAMTQLNSLPGLTGMDLSGITNIFQGFSSLQQLNGISIGQVTNTISGLGGNLESVTNLFGGLNPQQISTALGTLTNVQSLDMTAIGNVLSNIPGGSSINNVFSAFPAGMSPQAVSSIFQNIQTLPGLAGTKITDIGGQLSNLNPSQLATVFQGMNPASISSTITNLNGLSGFAGFDTAQITNVLNGVTGLQGALQGFNVNQVGNILTGLSGMGNLSNITNAVKGIASLQGLQGLSGLNVTQLSSLFSNMGSLTSFQGLQGLGIAQLNGVFQGLESLQNLTQIGGLSGMLTGLNSLNAADMGKLLSTFPQLGTTIQGLEGLGNTLGNLNPANIPGLGSGSLASLDSGSLTSVTGDLNGFTGSSVGNVTSAASGLASNMPSFLCPMPIEKFMTNPTSTLLSQVGGGSFLSGGPDNNASVQRLRGENVMGTKPNGCMAPKSTERVSLLTYSPWLYQSISNPADDSAGISLYRGMGNTYSDKMDMFTIGMSKTTMNAYVADGGVYIDRGGNAVTGNKNKNVGIGCKPMFDFVDKKLTPTQARYVLDNCSNQYILGNAFHNTSVPFVAAGAFSKNINASLCQKLTMYPYTDSDYDPKAYLEKAWSRTLETSPYPGMSFDSRLKLSKPELRGSMSINSVATGVERIYDPSHPFSPRYDFRGTERQTYSPLTAAYGEVGPCTVACAGVPVDLMRWRKPGFNKCIMFRISVNIACMSNYWCRLAVGKKPPCSTRFDRRDRYSFMCGEKIKKCCDRISKPLAPLNALKLMKNDGKRPEGYVFKEYFGNHRPYMRWWDTGAEAGGTNRSEPDLYSKEGSDDAIIGVGTEKQSCKYGGNGGGANPITSWAELKLYQARVFRDYNLNCLGSYEKLYKWGGSEEFVLARAGGEYSQRVAKGTYFTTVNRQFPLGWRGYISDPDVNSRFPNMFSTDKVAGAMVNGGLDEAQAGDIIMYDPDLFAAGAKRLPLLAYVTQANNKASYREKPVGGAPGAQRTVQGLEYVKVMDYNHGKFPDVCGVTDNWGIGQERTIYKTALPGEIETLFLKREQDANNNATKEHIPTRTCEDSDMGYCIEPLWSRIKIYRPIKDVR